MGLQLVDDIEACRSSSNGPQVIKALATLADLMEATKDQLEVIRQKSHELLDRANAEMRMVILKHFPSEGKEV